MTKQITLTELASIRSGYTLRVKLTDDPQSNLRVLQIGDLMAGVPPARDTLTRMQWGGSRQPPLLKVGDIVLPARGDNYPAVLVDASVPVIASGQLFVVSPKSDKITPDYLCWYLNHKSAQHYILQQRTGSSIPMLGIQRLGALPVPVLSLERQQQILDLQRCWMQEQRLTDQLLHNRAVQLDGIYQQLLEH